MATSAQSMSELFGHVISSYSRAQAIKDGVLIDVSEMAKEAGLILPTAMTDTVWESCVNWSDEDNKKQQTVQDIEGRLWDVLWMARCAIIAANKGQSREKLYELYVVPRDGKSRSARLTTLKVHVGPGDAAEPVLTIMDPGES